MAPLPVHPVRQHCALLISSLRVLYWGGGRKKGKRTPSSRCGLPMRNKRLMRSNWGVLCSIIANCASMYAIVNIRTPNVMQFASQSYLFFGCIAWKKGTQTNFEILAYCCSQSYPAILVNVNNLLINPLFTNHHRISVIAYLSSIQPHTTTTLRSIIIRQFKGQTPNIKGPYPYLSHASHAPV